MSESDTPSCRTEQECDWMPHCRIGGRCMKEAIAERLAASTAGLKLQEPVAEKVQASEWRTEWKWAERRNALPVGTKLYALPLSPADGPAFGIIDPDYARVFTQARIIAWQYGYACVMHGSFTRDLDLLLTPWEDRATPNHDQLAKLIADACGLHFRDGVQPTYKATVDWTDRPHGRKSTSLFFPAPADRRWIDISVTPCAAREARVEPSERSLSEPAKPNEGSPVSESARAVSGVQGQELQVLREYHQAFAGVFLAEMSLPQARLAAVARLRAADEKAGALVAEWDRARVGVGATPGGTE